MLFRNVIQISLPFIVTEEEIERIIDVSVAAVHLPRGL